MSQPTKETQSRFIGTFVNAIYAIVLSIGMGNIVFSDSFLLTDYLDLASAGFVVVVVAGYWWDWVDSVQEQVLSSLREFLIDLSMAFVFLTLFAFYDQPVTLAALFIALTCLDLLWVANSCYEHARSEAMSAIDMFVPLLRKMGAIAVFTILYLALRATGDTLHYAFQLVAVMVCFTVVRLSFPTCGVFRISCFAEPKLLMCSVS